MKKLFILFLFVLSATAAFSQDSKILLTEFTYDATNKKPLIFSRTLDVGGRPIQFNLPFAYHFEIKGSHVEFSIDYEDVKWYFFRKGDKSYFDLELNLVNKTGQGWSGGHGLSIPATVTIGIIRIILME